MQTKIIQGNNIEQLKQFPDNYFDAVVTDPPYGLGKEPDAIKVMSAWVSTGYHEIRGTGFMGKEWDAFVPQPLFWKEVYRVLKPGGHVLSFFGTRTYDWGVMAMRFAGFEVRDCIQWIYGCLSDDTEILTRSGYIQYHKFIKLPNFEQEEILIYDSENDIYKWEKPKRWSQYNIHKDTCYRIESDTTNQIVSRNHRCLVEREGKLIFVQAEQLSKMEYVPTLSNDFFELQESKVLQSPMQWILSGSGLEETRSQGEKIVVGRNQRKLSVISNGGKEYCLEGGNHISEKEGILFGSKIEICEMSEGVHSNGEERWLCGGVPLNDGKAVRQTLIENGVRTSYRPQSYEQRYSESDAICNEQGTQTIRTRRSYSTTLATITPIEYSGVIFCPTVSTGAFVARRNGKVFLTGNSGFPKSHNISKAIDKLEGTFIEGEESMNSRNGVLGDKGGYDHSKRITLPNPQSDSAKQWDGWGSALKPAHEDLVLARKPFQCSSDFVYLYEDIVYNLKLQICQSRLFAKDVREIFTLSQKEFQKEGLDFAQWSVGKPFNITEDLLVLMDMLQLELKEGNTTLNIVLSWLNILVELWNVANTYTTETESSTITELRILNSLEWESIFQNITVLKDNKTNGLIANVLTAESLFSVLNLKLNDILTHFVKDNVILKEEEKNCVPDSEPIVLARKPLEKGLSIAENVLKWGVGGINIDGCRIAHNEPIKIMKAQEGGNKVFGQGGRYEETTELKPEGRFPANIILGCNCEDESNHREDCAIKIMDEQSGILKSGKMTPNHIRKTNGSPNGIYGKFDVNHPLAETYGDSGGASRFFYCAKASKSERNKGLDKERWFNNLELVFDICSFTEQNLFIWEQGELSQDTGLNGEAQQKKDISEGIVLLVEDKECYTTLCGKENEVLFPKAIKFITSTGLNQIIELKTLNYYQPLNINDCIADVIETNKEDGLSLAENVGLKNLLMKIFTKDETGFLRGVKIVAKKTPQLINVKDVWQKTNIHTTVKPIKLMQYLVRLITPPNGKVLDPFCGSGTTGIACKVEGFDFVGIEQDPEYCKISEARIQNWVEEKEKNDILENEKTPIQAKLF